MIAAWSAFAYAGAWTREAGSLYSKAGIDVYEAFRFVAPAEGNEADQGQYFAHQYGVYAEAGLLRGHVLQAQVQVPFTVGILSTELVDPLRSIPLRATTARLGDLQFGLQAALHRRLPLSVALIAKVPLYGNGGVGEDYPAFAEVFPKPGDGQVDATAWLFGGTSLPSQWGTGFAEAGVGYRHRTEWFVGWPNVPETLSFVDSVAFTGKIGRRWGRVLPILAVDGVVPLAKDDWTRQFVTLSGSALVDLGNGLALEPRLAGDIHAKRASQGIGGGIGLSYQR